MLVVAVGPDATVPTSVQVTPLSVEWTTVRVCSVVVAAVYAPMSDPSER